MSVVLSADVFKAFVDVLEQMSNIISQESSFVSYEKKKLSLNTEIQVCVNRRYSDELKSTIHKILMDYALKAEKISTGGFSETIKKTKKLLNKRYDKKDVDVYIPKLLDIESTVSLIGYDKTIQNICFEAIKLAGFGGKISIEKSPNDISSIELIDGYTFSINSPTKNSLKLAKPYVLCIDGYIESVSEVNFLFESMVQSKKQLILISRGIHEDVLNTIKVNRDRATMYVYPIVVPFDLQGINTMNDISIVCGCDLISANLGNLISNCSVDNASQIDDATILKKSILLKNSKTKKAVNTQIKFLIEKRSDKSQDVEDLLNERIKSLSGNNVIIRLPDDKDFVSKSQSIDFILRSIKSMLDFGIYEEEDAIKLYATEIVSSEFSKKIINNISNVGAFLSN